MTFRLSAPPGSQGADGIALVFLSEPRMGQGGFGLGYTQQDLRAGDFAVEGESEVRFEQCLRLVDTFQSYDFADDPPVPHVSVHSPPHAHHRYSIACSRAACLPPLSDGREHSLEVVYDGSRRKLQGWLKAAGDAEAYDLWETEIPSPAQGDEAYWHIGVTGSTGGLWQKASGAFDHFTLMADGTARSAESDCRGDQYRGFWDHVTGRYIEDT